MADPITLSFIGGAALSGLVGAAADRFACKATRKVQETFLSGLRKPRNHDLFRAIRRSQLLALQLVVKAYSTLPHPTFRDAAQNDGPGYSPEDITTPLTTWTKSAIFREPDLETDLKTLADQDLTTWESRSQEFQRRVERVFVDPEPHDGSAFDRLQEVKTLSEDWFLAEIKARLGLVADWTRFEALFHGVEGADSEFAGWWRLFRAFLAEEIKRNDPVQRILTQQGIARILECQQDLAIAVGSLQQGLEDVVHRLDDVLADLRQATHTLEAATEAIEHLFERIDAFSGHHETALSQGFQKWFGIQVNSGTRPFDARIADAFYQRPTAMLIARHGIVPYRDVQGQLSDLLEWIGDPVAGRASGRLYLASGGFGKTRLAIEAIKRLPSGWRGTFLNKDNTSDLAAGSLVQMMSDPDVDGHLFVLDYAEGQVRLLEQVCTAANSATGKVRVLALARSKTGWWESTSEHQAVEIVFGSSAVKVLQPALELEDRKPLFSAACEAFAHYLELIGLAARPGTGRDDDLSTSRFDRPLLIAMAAYLTVNGVGHSTKTLLEQFELEEKKHWRRALRESPDQNINFNDPRMMSIHRLMAQITLVQGATRTGALKLLASDPRAAGMSRLEQEALVAKAELIYGTVWPGQDPARSEAIPALLAIEPDLLGEHIAMSALAEDQDGLARATLCAVLDGPPLFQSDCQSLLTVLTRASSNDHDHKTISAVPVALDGLALAAATLDASKVRVLESQLPKFATPLLRFSERVQARVVETADDQGEDNQAEFAGALNNHAIRLSDVGDARGALEPAQRAVEIYEELARSEPGRYLPDLAASLNNYANRLSEVGDARGALEPAQRAVEIREELAGSEPGRYLPDLAMSLNTYATRLSEVGDARGALEPAQRAVEIRKELARTEPGRYLPDLAMSLNTYANSLSGTGDARGALEPAQRAVEIYEELARSEPGRYLPDLAASLNNYANRLSEVGDARGALEPALRAVEIREDLARSEPRRYLPDLAKSLNNYANRLGEVGDARGALEPAQRAVEIREELARSEPRRYLPDLAMSLSNYAIRLSDVGDARGALEPAQRAVEIREELARSEPDRYLPDLAMSLNNYASFLSGTGDARGALEPAQRAVEIREELARSEPRRYLPDLARGYGARGQILSRAGDLRSAIESFGLGVAAIKGLAESMPEAYGGLLGSLVSDFSRTLKSDGATDEEIISRVEAFGIDPSLLSSPSQTGPRAVELYQTWVRAGQADDLEGAIQAYGPLVEELDQQEEDRRFDPIRTQIHQMHGQMGDDWPFGALPKPGE